MCSLIYQKLEISSHFFLEGEDALAFAQSQGTQDLSKGSGFAGYTLWLDHRGKINADSFILVENEERVRIVSLKTPGEFLKAKFERHIIADDVEISDVSIPSSLYMLAGLEWLNVLKKGGFPPIPSGEYLKHEDNFLWKTTYFGKETIAVLASGNISLLEKGTALSESEGERLRLESGTALIPNDLNEASTPLEGSLGHAISYTKGCYLGQEVVNRLSRLERSKYQLMRFCSDNSSAKSSNKVWCGENEVGEIRSSLVDTKGLIGFALVKVKDFQLDATVGEEPVVWETL
jgi:hypothetical protein